MVFRKKNGNPTQFYVPDYHDSKFDWTPHPNNQVIAIMRKKGYVLSRIAFIKQHVLYQVEQDCVEFKSKVDLKKTYLPNVTSVQAHWNSKHNNICKKCRKNKKTTKYLAPDDHLYCIHSLEHTVWYEIAYDDGELLKSDKYFGSIPNSSLFKYVKIGKKK